MMVEKKKEEKAEGEFEDVDFMPRVMDVGEVITGKFIGTRAGKFGDVFLLTGEDEERYNIYGGVQFSTVLTPDQIGRTFRIKYLGKVKTSKGQQVHTYKFQVKKEKSA